ncbi:MAG: tetratricopeptide repeat protein [Nitrospinae bacterium]|nr:tetratricopeptide repeat protein [Nitrospinota bacterium]
MRANSLLSALLCVILSLAACGDRDQALYEEAEKLWLNGRQSESVSKLRVVVEEYPSSSFAGRALFKLGEIHYLDLNEPDKAIEFFARVGEKEKNGELDLKAKNYIAEIYEQSLKKYDLAVMQYQRILNEHKGKVSEEEYRFKIGSAYFRKGDFQQAIVEYQSLLDKYPGGAYTLDSQYQIANSKFILNDAKGALTLFQKIMEASPKSKYEYDIRLGIAICYEEMEQQARALEEYNDLKQRYPDKPLIDRKIESIKKRLAKKSQPSEIKKVRTVPNPHARH